MQELQKILSHHASCYPLMQPTDAVKLIYQNEFGGGHLIRDTASCLEYLHREYAQVTKEQAVSLYEPIGNGLIRVNLAALELEELPRLGEAFIRSAAAHTGTLESFHTKLQILRDLCTEGIFSFSIIELDAYLSQYAQAGFPMVSHSEAYRSAYHPAYRIVRTDCWKMK